MGGVRRRGDEYGQNILYESLEDLQRQEGVVQRGEVGKRLVHWVVNRTNGI